MGKLSKVQNVVFRNFIDSFFILQHGGQAIHAKMGFFFMSNDEFVILSVAAWSITVGKNAQISVTTKSNSSLAKKRVKRAFQKVEHKGH